MSNQQKPYNNEKKQQPNDKSHTTHKDDERGNNQNADKNKQPNRDDRNTTKA